GGRRPFDASTPVGLMHAHLASLPPPLETCVPDIDREVAMLVDQMLAKHPAQRPTMPEVAGEVARLLGARGGIPPTPAEHRLGTLAAAPPRDAPPAASPLLETAAGDDDDPFVVGPPITDPRRFVGRQRILRRLVGLWR